MKLKRLDFVYSIHSRPIKFNGVITLSAFFRVSTLTTVFLSFLIIASNAIADEKDYVFTGKVDIAIRAYDPVSYHLEQRPVKGRSEFSTEWKGAVWHFSSAENRDLFISDPERWAPRYGGYCAYAAANDALAPTDPRAWTVYEDRLYLNYSLRVRKKWTKDIPGYIESADGNWPGVLSKLAKHTKSKQTPPAVAKPV